MTIEPVLWGVLGLIGLVGGVLGLAASWALARGDRRN
ncbi:hypothetical protein ATJ78_0021 [Paramicrobacterium agarici]|uniref:Uncharacterized protein n=1 Tax=Paramicrobacterium agarici TaxID=630514 RepID=A0A2A9DSJ3_9MICO|nr:hypothetical protein ATJ78_0021 [Microbacterium agarici]